MNCPKCGREMAYLDHEGKDPDSIRWVCFNCGHEQKVDGDCFITSDGEKDGHS